LYAAYSLDETFDQGVDSERPRIVNRWKRDIRLVARQEMAHFVTVQNLLISLGAEVYLNRENNFSDHPDAYPFSVRFEKFDVNSLARYVATEAPATEEITDPTTRAELEGVLRLADQNSKTKINRVGVLYAALYWLFLKTDAADGPWRMPESVSTCMQESGMAGVHLKDNDFVPVDEYREFAANREEWEVYEDSSHVDDADPRTSALNAIHWIMLQGEGPSGSDCDGEESHFCRFLEIYKDFLRFPDLSKAAMAVPLNPVVLNSHRTEPVDPESEPITHPESSLWGKLFNTRYQMLLLDVLLALSTSLDRKCGDPELRSTLSGWASRYEMEFLKRIGQLLPTLPRHEGTTHPRAGAPFETVQFPADNTKRWDQQRVLIEGSLELVLRLKSKMLPHDQRYSLLQAIEDFDHARKSLVEGRATAARHYIWKEGNRRV
jgi:Ferritin-like